MKRLETKIVTVCNQKGGVGKTTTVFNTAYSLGQLGYSVLVVDFDPQSTLTRRFGVDPTQLKYTVADQIEEAMLEKVICDPRIIASPCCDGKVDLLPCSPELSEVDSRIAGAIGREFFLTVVLDQYNNQYDYIIIDTCPSLGVLLINALIACQGVIVIVEAAVAAAEGLQMLLTTLHKVKRLNRNVKIDGILLTQYTERYNAQRTAVDMVHIIFGEQIHIFGTSIPKSVAVEAAEQQNMPICKYNSQNSVAYAYNGFAKEYSGESVFSDR